MSGVKYPNIMKKETGRITTVFFQFVQNVEFLTAIIQICLATRQNRNNLDSSVKGQTTGFGFTEEQVAPGLYICLG
jgi:hypothetical protein